MLNPQLVAGKHGFLGDHESEDIRIIFKGGFDVCDLESSPWHIHT